MMNRFIFVCLCGFLPFGISWADTVVIPALTITIVDEETKQPLESIRVHHALEKGLYRKSLLFLIPPIEATVRKGFIHENVLYTDKNGRVEIPSSIVKLGDNFFTQRYERLDSQFIFINVKSSLGENDPKCWVDVCCSSPKGMKCLEHLMWIADPPNDHLVLDKNSHGWKFRGLTDMDSENSIYSHKGGEVFWNHRRLTSGENTLVIELPRKQKN